MIAHMRARVYTSTCPFAQARTCTRMQEQLSDLKEELLDTKIVMNEQITVGPSLRTCTSGRVWVLRVRARMLACVRACVLVIKLLCVRVIVRKYF